MKLIKKRYDKKLFQRIFAIAVAVFFIGSVFTVFSYTMSKIEIYVEIWIKDYTNPYANTFRIEKNQTIASVLIKENIQMNESCLGFYCNDEEYLWKMFVNGIENTNFDEYKIQDKDIVVFNYSKF